MDLTKIQAALFVVVGMLIMLVCFVIFSIFIPHNDNTLDPSPIENSRGDYPHIKAKEYRVGANKFFEFVDPKGVPCRIVETRKTYNSSPDVISVGIDCGFERR